MSSRSPAALLSSLDAFQNEVISFDSAARFCCAFDELRNYLRPRFTMEKPVPSQRNDKPIKEGL